MNAIAALVTIAERVSRVMSLLCGVFSGQPTKSAANLLY
jgi:hypothetical protein